MKPSQIHAVLDLAWEARKLGEVFNPIFTGDAGLGKSAIVQQWVDAMRQKIPNFFFLDLRIAYLEAPDMIGFPGRVKVIVNGEEIWTTVHAIPEIWPLDKETQGLILLEEPNRGTPGVMNCLMQVLTDRKIHLHKLPENIIIAACINPDSARYDVNTMDTALKNRFEEFEIEYDHMTFCNYMHDQQWHEDVVRFFGESGIWIYKTPDAIGEGQQYISPRTVSKIQAAMKAGLKLQRSLHYIASISILGKEIGNEFHRFCFDQAPVTARDLLTNKEQALARLRQQCDENDYKGEMILMTIESIVKEYGGTEAKDDQISEQTMAEVAKIIPKDQALNLIKDCGFKDAKGNITSFFKSFIQRYPELVDILRASISVQRATDKK